jgi:hypothetical protein
MNGDGDGDIMNIEALISPYVGGRHRGPDAYAHPVEIASYHATPRHRAEVSVATIDHVSIAVSPRHRADPPAA